MLGSSTSLEQKSLNNTFLVPGGKNVLTISEDEFSIVQYSMTVKSFGFGNEPLIFLSLTLTDKTRQEFGKILRMLIQSIILIQAAAQ